MKTDEEIEEMAKASLDELHRWTTLTVTKEEDNIYYAGFHAAWRQAEENTPKECGNLLCPLRKILSDETK